MDSAAGELSLTYMSLPHTDITDKSVRILLLKEQFSSTCSYIGS